MSKLTQRVASYFVITILLLSVLASLSYYDKKLWFPAANAVLNVPLDFDEADGKIYYVSAEGRQRIEISVTADSGKFLWHQGIHYLPDGITVTREGTSTNELVIRVGQIQIEEDQLPITYGINLAIFNTIEADDPTTRVNEEVQDVESEASILFVVEGKNPEDMLSPTIRFDNEMYSGGDEAIIVVSDPHLYCDVPANDTVSTASVQVSVTLNGNALSDSPFTAERDPYSNDEFRLPLAVPSDPGTLEAQYTPQASILDECVFPSLSSEAVQAQATTSAERISFQNRAYLDDETATLTVIDTADPEEIRFSATRNVGGEAVPVSLPAVTTGLTRIADTVLTTTINMRELVGDLQETVTLSATYGDSDQDTVTILPERTFSFIIPEGRSSYFTNDTASVVVMDPNPQYNSDHREFNSYQVTLCSYNASSALPINNNRILVPIVETGRNTATFVNSYHLSFIDQNVATTSLSGQELELFEQSNIRVLLTNSTLVLGFIGNQLCPSQGDSPSGISVQVLESTPSDPDGITGKGTNAGAVAHRATPLYTVSQVNCNQYNYGGDIDLDGICDNWETTTGLKLYYPAGGSFWTLTYTNDPAPKPDHKDVFVEIDYIDNTLDSACVDGRTSGGNSYMPSTTPVNNVEAAFRAAPVNNDDGADGIELHIYLDDKANPPGDDCVEKVRVWGDDGATGELSFDEIKRDNFGRDDSERIDVDNKGKAKAQVFHYGLSIPKQQQDTGSSGVAEQLGNDFVISLGIAGFSWSTNHIQGTLMHELGHNLGLYHGGPDVSGNDYNVNCKPNYPSVMTYIRQINTPYTNNSLTYSDDAMSPVLLNSRDPNENDILRLITAGGVSLVELVWGINPGGGVILLNGDAVAHPGVPGDVSASWSDVSWNGDSTILNADPVPGDSVANVNILGCYGSDTNDTLSGASDWGFLQNSGLNFRNLNPDTFETGFGPGSYYPFEANATIIRAAYGSGINTTDYLFQKLNYTSIKQPASCEDLIPQLTDGNLTGNFEVDTEYTVGMNYNAANIDPNDIDMIENITISSDSDPNGITVSAIETDLDTGIFTFDFETGSMNGTGKILVQDGDTVRIEITDMCSVAPFAEGNDIIVTFKVGGDSSSLMIERISGVQKFFTNKLVGNAEDVKSSNVSSSVLELVMNDDHERAIQELLALRQYIDGAAGGNKTDDAFKEDWETERALRFLTSNIAALKEANNTAYEEFDPFIITSLDYDCTDDDNTTHGCTINGFSDSATAVADKFRIDDSNKTIGIVFTGQENVTLAFADDLATHVSSVKSKESGGEYDFSVVRNDTTTLLMIEGLSYSPGEVLISYWEDIVSPFSIELESTTGDPLRQVTAGEQVSIAVTLENHEKVSQPFVAIVEVRDVDGLTVSLAWQSGNIAGKDQSKFGLSWMPQESRDYQVRTFVISDFTSPEILSLVSDKNVIVGPDPQITSDKMSYKAGEPITVTIEDPDADIKPSSVDSLPRIRVFSDSDIAGLTVNATETAENSGLFQLTFETSELRETGKLFVRDGDKITIEYTDKDKKEFTFTTEIERI